MSIGVKTATGDVKIHSVHVVPADGYTSNHDIMENIWANDYGYSGSAEYKNVVIENRASSGKINYVNIGGTIDLGLKLLDIDSTEVPKILTSIAATSSSNIYRRYNTIDGGMYPNKREYDYTQTIQYSTDDEFIINQSAFRNIHPAIVNKNIPSNKWTRKTKNMFLYDFYTVFGLTNYTFTGEEKLILVNDNSAYRLWVIPNDTTFTLTNNVITPSKSLTGWSMTKSSYFRSSVVRTSKVNISYSASTYNPTIAVSSILASTFDIKLTDETIVYSKNANVSDFVEIT